MKTSSAGLAFICAQEGCILHPYKDQIAVWTIGIGHAIRPSEQFPPVITQAQAFALLAQDLASAEAEVSRDLQATPAQNVFDACADFAYNCGTGGFRGSSTRARLNAGDVPGAASALLVWDKGKDPDTGKLVVLPVLHRRRVLEGQMMLQGMSHEEIAHWSVAQNLPPGLPPVTPDTDLNELRALCQAALAESALAPPPSLGEDDMPPADAE